MDKKYKQTVLICWNNNDGFGKKIKDQIEKLSLKPANNIKTIEDGIQEQLKQIRRVSKIEQHGLRINIKNDEEKIKQLERMCFNVELCDCSSSLKVFFPLEKQIESKDITHLIVLCELKWSHNNDDGAYSDMNGIKLVQDYIRTKERNKMPVLFVSFLKRKEIITQHADKKIINTPTLQHEFIDILEPIEKWIEKISKMEQMSKLDLEYTIKNFCDSYGLVRSILHSISGNNSIPAIKEQINTLRCVIKHQNNNFHDIEKMCENIEKMCENTINLQEIQNNIKRLSEELSKRLNTEQDTSEKINVLYIEDEFNTDSRITSFRKEAKKDNIIILNPSISATKQALEASNGKDFEESLGTDIRWNQFNINSFSTDIRVIICDIEIWDNPLENKERLLIAQGYDFIKKMISFGYGDKKYLILTNCTRDLYSDITSHIVGKNRNVKIDIDNKDTVLDSKILQKKYINKIRTLANIKENPDSTITGSIFDEFYNYINNNNKIFFWVKSRKYDEIESIIDKQLPIIINAWKENKDALLAAQTDKEKNRIRKIIKGKLDFGGDFGKQQRNTKQKKNYSSLDIEKNIGNFVKKLIFRRFVIHLIEIDGVEIQDAFLALSPDERFYSNVLLFPKLNINTQYTDEEKAYIKRVKQSSNCPPA